MTNSQEALLEKYETLRTKYYRTLEVLERQYFEESITPGFYIFCTDDLKATLEKHFHPFLYKSDLFKYDYFEDFFKGYLNSIPECSSWYIRNKATEFEEYLKTIKVREEPELEAVLKEVCTSTCSIYDIIDPEKPFKI